MADIKWSAFPSGGAIVAGDETVGLRAGANVRLTANTFGNLSLGTNTLSSTNSNGNINLVPNGTGVTTVGTSTSTGIGGTGSFIVAGTSVQPLIGQASYSNGSSGFSNVHNMYKSRGASVGSQVAVVSGDTIGAHQFYGSDGTNFLNAATIVGSVSGAVSAGIVPGQLVLRTATTLGVMTTAITISNAQLVTLANALPVTSGGTGLTSTTANQLLYSSATSTIAGLATANNGLLVTSAGGVPSIGNAIGADITIQGVTSGRGPGAIATNTTFGAAAGFAVTAGGIHLSSFGYQANGSIVTATDSSAFGYNSLVAATGGFNSAFGSGAGKTVTTGTNNTLIGFNSAQSNIAGQVNMTSGSTNTLLGFQTGVNNLATIGSVAIGANAQSDIATGSTSGTNGPGIAIGSATFPVGFRGDGTIYPSTTGAGFWRPKLNGTYYNIPLLTDGATAWPAITTSSVAFTTTSGIIGTTTNNSAAAGSVGEILSTVVLIGSPVSLTTATPANIATLSLTAGDWDVWGEVWTAPDVTTTTSSISAAISATTGTLPTVPAVGTALSVQAGFAAAAGISVVANTGSCRVSLSGTTTYYLVASVAFAISTLSGYGVIRARRRR